MREWAATALVAGIFLFYAFSRSTIHWLPVVAAILACLPMTFVATFHRKRPATEISHNLTDHLRDSIASVRHQVRLLRSVLWWYLAPLALSVMLIQVDAAISGRVHFDGKLLLSSLAAVIVFFGVWKLNQRTVRTDLEPRLHELEKTLAELETERLERPLWKPTLSSRSAEGRRGTSLLQLTCSDKKGRDSIATARSLSARRRIGMTSRGDPANRTAGEMTCSLPPCEVSAEAKC